ncbi:hypothetical protein [Microbulbifer aggregans]|uniref:hypothetical protein n=1 Tax=Microbulbifer aggregans TaxID=1769779 RepID=UPI001D05BCF3|nr:hypothetical protein [Microbulbifer aggregans]
MDLVNQREAVLQQTAIGIRVYSEVLEMLARLRQRLVNFTAQPIQGLKVGIVVIHAKSSVNLSVRGLPARSGNLW